MYYTNIANSELQYFHNLPVSNFTIRLTDLLTSGLFRVDEVIEGSIYKIYPLFYTKTILSSYYMDRILDNRCIICKKQENRETYLTFISDENAAIQDYQSFAEYFDITDSLSTAQFNMIVSLLRQNTIHNDTFNMLEEVKGNYAKYTFDIDGCTITDAGIVIDDDTRTAEPKVMLSNNVFHYSTYTLKLDVMHYTGVNILDDVSPSDFIIVDTMELELPPDEWVTIPLTDLQDGYIISMHTNVEIKHDKPVIPDWIQSLEVKSEPTIIQKNETAEFYATGLDNGKMPVREGHTIHFFEKLEPSLTVSATPSIIQTSENSEIYAKVKDSDGSLATNVQVHFYKALDYWFKYKGLSSTSTIDDSFGGADSRVTVSKDATGTTLTGNNSSNPYIFWADVDGDNNYFDFYNDVSIDFDVVSLSGQGAYLQIYAENSTQYFHKPIGSNGMGISTSSQVHIDVVNGLVTVKVNGTIVASCTTQTDVGDNNYRIGFRGYGGDILTFKNFIIKKMEDD